MRYTYIYIYTLNSALHIALYIALYRMFYIGVKKPAYKLAQYIVMIKSKLLTKYCTQL